mmetsp:Transcript_13175/g.22638  ORF Transcript_13175/g.22638 Transcript_13175/m.22638 type:complete len:256 (-) Transcript_13175:600-1367(-)
MFIFSQNIVEKISVQWYISAHKTGTNIFDILGIVSELEIAVARTSIIVVVAAVVLGSRRRRRLYGGRLVGVVVVVARVFLLWLAAFLVLVGAGFCFFREFRRLFAFAAGFLVEFARRLERLDRIFLGAPLAIAFAVLFQRFLLLATRLFREFALVLERTRRVFLLLRLGLGVGVVRLLGLVLVSRSSCARVGVAVVAVAATAFRLHSSERGGTCLLLGNLLRLARRLGRLFCRFRCFGRRFLLSQSFRFGLVCFV